MKAVPSLMSTTAVAPCEPQKKKVRRTLVAPHGAFKVNQRCSISPDPAREIDFERFKATVSFATQPNVLKIRHGPR